MAVSSREFSHFGVMILYIPLFILSVVCKLFFLFEVLYIRRATLSSIPGPKWAAWTRFWIVKTLASGQSAEIFAGLNKQYGPLVRIGPKHLLTNDPALTRKILAARSGYTRGPWFDSLRIDPHTPNIVSERDEKKHVRLRYKLSASYTSKNVNAMEPIIDERLLDWLRRLNSMWASEPGKLKSFDIGKRIQFLTVDIITELCLGTALGCVASDSDKHDFLATVQRGNTVCQHFSVLLELNSLMYYLTKLPFLGPLIVPKASDRAGVGRIMGITRKAVESQKDTGASDKNDMIGSLLKHGVPEQQIDAELVIALYAKAISVKTQLNLIEQRVAGSDTTSTAVQSTLLAIILNPRVYQTLKLEIRTAVAEQVAYPIRDAEAKQLRYLQACVLEGLRKFPPLSQLRERVVPPGGDVIRGHHIPAGTFIGLNAWGTQLDEVFGDDPEVFRPERWLTDNEDQLRAMRQTHELIFGHGSTKCLGMPIAMMELSKMIFELLRNFDIEIANPYKPWSSICYGIFFQKDFNVHLTRTNM